VAGGGRGWQGWQGVAGESRGACNNFCLNAFYYYKNICSFSLLWGVIGLKNFWHNAQNYATIIKNKH